MSIRRMLFFITLTMIGVIFLLKTPALDGKAERDFAAYWSATRLLLSHRNPYDPTLLQELQESVLSSSAMASGSNVAAWNPPWLLLALIPLGLLPFDVAARLMFLTNLLLITFSVIVVWRWVRPGDRGYGATIALLIAVFFHGSFMTFMIGQVSTLVLISLLAGVCLLSRRRDFLAGFVLLLSASKPHVVYFVFVVLGIWVIRERRRQVVVGGLTAIALSLILCTLFYPGWLAGYSGLVQEHNFMQYSTSTVGGLMYVLIGSSVARYAGILLIPLIPLMLKIVDSHGWLTATNVALLVSLPLAPYGFSFDQVVLVPAVVQCVALVWCSGLSWWLSGFTYGVLAIICAVPYWIMLQQGAGYHLFTWIPLVLLALYLLVGLKTNPRSGSSEEGKGNTTYANCGLERLS